MVVLAESIASIEAGIRGARATLVGGGTGCCCLPLSRQWSSYVWCHVSETELGEGVHPGPHANLEDDVALGVGEAAVLVVGGSASAARRAGVCVWVRPSRGAARCHEAGLHGIEQAHQMIGKASILG